MKSNKMNFRQNYKFVSSAIANDQTFIDYMNRFEKIALSIFEWVNLPKSMDARWLEKCLFYFGMASILKDEKYGFINTKCCSNGYVNIYGLPTSLHCYSFGYDSIRKLYTGLKSDSKKMRKYLENSECILVQNNWQREPTFTTMELFAFRLYEAEQTAFVNIKAQKTPVLVVVDEKQRLLMENLYNQYDGNQPVIVVDKNYSLIF